MNFTLPVTIILAVFFLTASVIENRFFPRDEQALQEITAAPIPADTVKVIPKPTVPPADGIAGFRVQVFASANEQSAKGLKEKLKHQVSYPVYVTFSDTEWKVQIGDFIGKKDAESFCNEMRKGEFTDSWVVEAIVKPPVDGFRVQIATFRNNSSALSYSRLVEKEVNSPVYIIKSADIWIIRVGDFTEKAEAESFSESMKKKGYKDAMVTADKVYK